MLSRTLRKSAALHCALLAAAALGTTVSPWAAAGYAPIAPTLSDRTVVLDGASLTIEQIVMVARHGAQVVLRPAAQQHQADNYGLLLEASAEGVPVYWFNRGAGSQRETVMFSGDPLSAENKAYIEQSQDRRFHAGALAGLGPEVEDEGVVRAMMVVRANAMVYNAPSPPLSQMLLDLLNKRVTPVVQSRGTLGEADLAQLGNVGATMVGAGEAYYQGTRMSAAEALTRAGLKPIQPFGADDNALMSSNAYATGQAALLVSDARAALEWADLLYAIDLDGMNSSITPLSLAVQRDRPGKWLNWHAARMLDMLKGSYLFGADEKRIIQDPESLRASSIRQAATWEEWSALNAAVLFQVNSSDHNPAVSVGLGPKDSWELATPQLMRFYVKGGPHSRGQHGYIVSNANWDPFPMANRIESFTIALANMDIAVMSRIERFRNPFFTGASAAEVFPGRQAEESGYGPVDMQQEVQSLMSPVAPFGAAIVATVEDLQSQTRIKVQRARQAVEATMQLLGLDLLQGSLWLDVRAAQDPNRAFGAAPKAAWSAFRAIVPLRRNLAEPGVKSAIALANGFLRTTPASTYYPAGLPN